MRTKPYSAVVLLWCWLVVVASVYAESKSPRVVVPEPTFHFEPILQGTIVRHDFKIQNAGDAELVIHKVVPGCGCTATKISSKTIPPGGESIISAEFNSAGFIGRKIRTISVETNDPRMPIVDLTIEGLINSEISVEPNALSFGEIAIGSSVSLDLIVRKVAGSKTTIREVSSRNKSIAVSGVRREPDREIYKVTLTAEGKIGGVRGLVNITINDKSRTTLPIPFFATFVKAQG
jgi:hypothetical protein